MKEKSLLNKLIANPIIQTIVIFVSGGWIVLEITEYLIVNFALNEIARNILLIILISLLPIAVFLAWYYSRKKTDKDSRQKIVSIPLKKRRVLQLGILILIAFVTSLGLRLNHKSKLDTALNHTLPELNYEIEDINISDGERNWIVYNKSIKLKKILKNRPEFHQFWKDITVKLSITTNPKKAKVYAKPYSKPDTSWYYLGETPLVEFPFPGGLSRIKIEKPGFEVQYDILYKAFGWGDELVTRQYQLFRLEEIPENMVRAQGFKGDWNTTGSLPIKEAGDFWIDRFEVTNNQYKTFIDSGGYNNPIYWDFPFVEGKDTLSWETAMKQFKDKTDWPGPATWEMSEFLEGEKDLPVTGVTWYEAAAYAKFLNKELPTIFHWTYISEIHGAPEIVKFGNFDSEGPIKVGSNQSMTRYGTFDLAGNVSEWIFNSVESKNMIIGGNYQEPSYFYNNYYSISPWTRSDRVGFRCMRYINDTLKNDLTKGFDQADRDFTKVQPVSDEIFKVIKESYNYKKGELNVKVVSTFDTTVWMQETVLVNVQYENTPLQILVYLPKDSNPPYQTVIYYPHIGALRSNSLEDMSLQLHAFDFLIKSGRAVIWPVYYSTYGRGEILAQNMQTRKISNIYKIIDFQITCDYLSTRSDIDQEKMAFYGLSWGGFMSPYILAIENRIKVGIIAAFGVLSSGKYQDMDQINYLPRVKIPMLMMNGRYDFDFTMKTQQAFYDFLGTPENDKEWKLYDYVHGVPRTDLINESLDWLDKYFGPVSK